MDAPKAKQFCQECRRDEDRVALFVLNKCGHTICIVCGEDDLGECTCPICDAHWNESNITPIIPTSAAATAVAAAANVPSNSMASPFTPTSTNRPPPLPMSSGNNSDGMQFNSHHVNILKRAFRNNPKPGYQEFIDIAAKIGCNRRKVKGWFKSERLKVAANTPQQTARHGRNSNTNQSSQFIPKNGKTNYFPMGETPGRSGWESDDSEESDSKLSKSKIAQSTTKTVQSAAPSLSQLHINLISDSEDGESLKNVIHRDTKRRSLAGSNQPAVTGFTNSGNELYTSDKPTEQSSGNTRKPNRGAQPSHVDIMPTTTPRPNNTPAFKSGPTHEGLQPPTADTTSGASKLDPEDEALEYVALRRINDTEALEKTLADEEATAVQKKEEAERILEEAERRLGNIRKRKADNDKSKTFWGEMNKKVKKKRESLAKRDDN